MVALLRQALDPLLGMSVTAAFAAVVVMLLRAVLKNRAPKRIVCLLWLAVFARLLVPVMVATPFSLVPNGLDTAIQTVVKDVREQAEPSAPLESADPEATPSDDPLPDGFLSAPSDMMGDPIEVEPEYIITYPGVTTPVTEPGVPMEEPSAEENAPEPVRVYVLPAVWLAGVAVMLAAGIGSCLKLRRRVFDAIRTSDGVWEHPSLTSPFILGLIRPKIYLPMGIEGQSRQFILHHERAHIRRLDHIVKPICWLALTLHWFNPMAWVAFALMSRDIETACDESVLRQLGSEIKTEYAETLLALATKKRFPAPSPVSFDEGDAETRIKHVLRFKKPALWVSIGAAVIVLIASVCLLSKQSHRNLDSYYPAVNWEEAELVTAYLYAPLNKFPAEPECVKLSAEAAAEVTEVLHEYKYLRELYGLSMFLDERVGWQDSLWEVCYQFENGTSITLDYTESGTLVVYLHRSNVLPDGSAVNHKTRHFAVDGAEQLAAEILDIIMREFKQDMAEVDLSACTTEDAYPGLYFLREPSATLGVKITAYKLINGDPVLVGGYEERLTNNFTILTLADGEREAVYSSSENVYAVFEKMLVDALDPDWPEGALNSASLNEFLVSFLRPEISDCTTRDAYPGLYFLEEPSSTAGIKVTAYKLIDGELVLVGGYEEHQTSNFDILIHADGKVETISHSSSVDVCTMFEKLLTAALDPEWLPGGDVPAVADPATLSAVGQLFHSVLNDEVEIVDTGLGKTDVLSVLVRETAPAVEMSITGIAAVDLDGDGIKEVLLLLETPGTVHGTMILRYDSTDGQIYAYELGFRAFNDVKADGTFTFSGGASDSGFGRISFKPDGYEVERITYCETTYPDSGVAYYVNKQPVTPTEFDAACREWSDGLGILWLTYTEKDVRNLISAAFGENSGDEAVKLRYANEIMAAIGGFVQARRAIPQDYLRYLTEEQRAMAEEYNGQTLDVRSAVVEAALRAVSVVKGAEDYYDYYDYADEDYRMIGQLIDTLLFPDYEKRIEENAALNTYLSGHPDSFSRLNSVMAERLGTLPEYDGFTFESYSELADRLYRSLDQSGTVPDGDTAIDVAMLILERRTVPEDLLSKLDGDIAELITQYNEQTAELKELYYQDADSRCYVLFFEEDRATQKWYREQFPQRLSTYVLYENYTELVWSDHLVSQPACVESGGSYGLWAYYFQREGPQLEVAQRIVDHLSLVESLLIGLNQT